MGYNSTASHETASFDVFKSDVDKILHWARYHARNKLTDANCGDDR